MTASRSAMLIPKPTRRHRKPFLPALDDVGLSLMLGGLAPRERKAMAAIAESADLLTIDDKSWLLVPASPQLLDTLAAFGAEDREPCLEDEPNGDMEPDCGMESDDPAEYDVPEARRPFAEARRKPRESGLIIHGSDRNLWRLLSM